MESMIFKPGPLISAALSSPATPPTEEPAGSGTGPTHTLGFSHAFTPLLPPFHRDSPSAALSDRTVTPLAVPASSSHDLPPLPQSPGTEDDQSEGESVSSFKTAHGSPRAAGSPSRQAPSPRASTRTLAVAIPQAQEQGQPPPASPESRSNPAPRDCEEPGAAGTMNPQQVTGASVLEMHGAQHASQSPAASAATDPSPKQARLVRALSDETPASTLGNLELGRHVQQARTHRQKQAVAHPASAEVVQPPASAPGTVTGRLDPAARPESAQPKSIENPQTVVAADHRAAKPQLASHSRTRASRLHPPITDPVQGASGVSSRARHSPAAAAGGSASTYKQVDTRKHDELELLYEELAELADESLKTDQYTITSAEANKQGQTVSFTVNKFFTKSERTLRKIKAIFKAALTALLAFLPLLIPALRKNIKENWNGKIKESKQHSFGSDNEYRKFNLVS